MHRLFVALSLPETISDSLVDAMDDSPALRWVGDENLHLTLRFIGEVERPVAEDVARALQAIRSPAFAIRLTGIGMFDHRSGGAIWAGVEPREPVAALAAKVNRACQVAGIEPERRAYHPHVTLARYRNSSMADAQGFIERTRGLSTPVFKVDAFTLFESRLSRHGPLYEAIASSPLDRP
jgi:2'-5' RNA ligase